MKRFQFSLESVLGYKQQTLDSLKAEHGAIMARIRQQEQILSHTQARYDALNEEYRVKKNDGVSVNEALFYQNGLRVLENEIHRELTTLNQLHQEGEAKRAQVVGAKQDTSSLEKLREKKLECYNKEFQRSEETFIDELVCTARANAPRV